MKVRHLLMCLLALLCVGTVSAQKKKVAFVYQPGYNASRYVWGAAGYDPTLDPIHTGLAAAFDLTDVTYEGGVEADYDYLKTFDLVVLCEAMSGNTTLTNNLVKLVGEVPILSFKAYNYTSGRWGWASPQNPGTRTPSVTINPGFENHPIFKGVTVVDGVVQIFSGEDTQSNLIQGFTSVTETGKIELENIIATVTGTEYHAIHELKNVGKPYLMIPISSDVVTTVTDNGVKLVVNAANYLLGGGGIPPFNPDAPFKIAYLFDSSYSTYVGHEEDPIYVYSVLGEKETEAIDIKDFTAASTDVLDTLENYDLIVVSEAINSGHPFAKLLLQLVNRVPMLNFKSFFYKIGVWDWGAGVNPTDVKAVPGVTSITIAEEYLDHPLFQDMDIEEGIITLFNDESVKKNMVQAYTAKAGGFIDEDPVLATVTGTSGTYNAIHLHGKTNTYLLLPLSCDALVVDGEINLTDPAFQLINNAVYYLLQTAGTIVPALRPTLTLSYGNEVTYVTMATGTEGADIRYTIDGSEPTASSTLYTGPVAITAPCTVKAAAFKQGYDMSPVASIDVDVWQMATEPTITVTPGDQGKTISISAAPGARIFYLTNGGTPDTLRSNLYAEPFTVTRPCVVKAIALEEGKLPSLAAEEKITIDGYTERNKTLVWADFDTHPSKWYWNGSDATITSNTDLFGSTGFPYDPDTVAINDCQNGFVVGSQGQRVVVQTTSPAASGDYGPYTDGDAGATKMGISLHRNNTSSDPSSAFLMTTTAYDGPFDVLVWFVGTQGSDSYIEKLEVSVAPSMDAAEWTVLDTLVTTGDKLVRKGVAHYDESAPVFVKVKCVSNLGTGGKVMIFDVKLMGEGQDVSIRKPALDRQVVSVRYYNLAGQPMKGLSHGLNIVRTIYSDGSVETTKVMLNERR